LGYNGRTTQRDLARIVHFNILKAFVLSLVCGQPGKEHETIELMIRTFNGFVITLLIKYRPEWYQIYSIADVTFSSLVFGLIWHSPSLGIACIMMMFVVCISSFYYDVVRRLFWDIKACERMTRLRNAWKDSYDRNPEAVSQLAQTCKEICGVLSQQRDDALHMLSLFDKARAYLDEHVGRWILRGRKGTVKARQKCSDIDVLFSNAGAINEPFQELVSRIGFNGCSVNHSAGLEFGAGPAHTRT
jgi:hypothetical protein